MAGPPAPVAAPGVAVAKREAPKPVPKRVTAKPKPVVEVIEISPDEQIKKEKSVSKKKEADPNSKKKTLTSVLTARSKVDY